MESVHQLFQGAPAVCKESTRSRVHTLQTRLTARAPVIKSPKVISKHHTVHFPISKRWHLTESQISLHRNVDG